MTRTAMQQHRSSFQVQLSIKLLCQIVRKESSKYFSMFSVLLSAMGNTICVCSADTFSCSSPEAAVTIVLTLWLYSSEVSLAARMLPRMSSPVLASGSAGMMIKQFYSCYWEQPLTNIYNIADYQEGQSMIQQVESLISLALTYNENYQREQAERSVFSLLNADATAFFFACSGIAADENKHELIRQSAASVMKVVLAKKIQNSKSNQCYWDLVSAENRNQIKGILLSNLVSTNYIVMRAAANTIAQIAAIQITRGQWLEIIDSLAENTTHQQVNIRQASITTLGFICEELKAMNSKVNIESCKQILDSLLFCLQQEGDICKIALNALRESVGFLQELLRMDQNSDKLFEYVLQLMDGSMKGKVYEILIELGRLCYQMLDKYIEKIVIFTCQDIKDKNDNSILALDLWDTLGLECKSKGIHFKNFLQQYEEKMIPTIMGAMLIETKQDLYFPELREGAMKTLSTFVSCCNRQVVQKVMEGVSKVIVSPQAGHRQASCLIFSCLAQYPDHVYIQECFSNGFQHLYQLLNDSDIIVRKNTLNGFVTLSESFQAVFLRNSQTRQIFSHLLNLASDQDEDVRILSLIILCQITDGLLDQSIISQSPSQLLTSLLCMFTDNLQDSQRIFSNDKILLLLFNIIAVHQDKQSIISFVNHIIELYSQYSKRKMQNLNIVLSQLLTLVHTSILSIIRFDVDEAFIGRVFALIDMHFGLMGLDEDGIKLISAAIMSFNPSSLQDHFDRFWSQVVSGLDMMEQRPIFKASISCISDYARSRGGKLNRRFMVVFEKLITCLINSSDISQKAIVMECLGDICLGVKPYCEMFIERLIQISDDCMQAINNFPEYDEQGELKMGMMAMYHSLVFSNEGEVINYSLANHFQKISVFVVNSCAGCQNAEYLRLCGSVIFDSARFYLTHHNYRAIAGKIIHSEQVRELLGRMKRLSNGKDVEELLVLAESMGVISIY